MTGCRGELKGLVFRLFPVAVMGILAVFLMTGCGTKASRFYILSPLVPTTLQAPQGESSPSIGIGPVDIPEYLNRSQVVTRKGKHEITISEFDRWGASLSEALPKVISENLAGLLSTDKVLIYPFRETPSLDYRVEIEVIRFDGDLPGNLELLARWRLISGDETSAHRFYSKKPIAGQGYPGLVSAMSLALYDLCKDIASEISSHRNR